MSEVGKVVGRFPPKSSEVRRLFAVYLALSPWSWPRMPACSSRQRRNCKFCGVSLSEVNGGLALAFLATLRLRKITRKRLKGRFSLRATVGGYPFFAPVPRENRF